LDDVIERIENMSLDENSTPSQSYKKPGPSQKGPPKWLTKTLESVHPDEVTKRQEPEFSKDKTEAIQTWVM
jgi:hypothetical protein